MYDNKKIIAIIPARSGSKGIHNKNIRIVYKKPLIAYTIGSAINSTYIDYVFVSTNSKKIANISKEYGAKVPFLRSQKMALDESKTIDCVLEAMQKFKTMKMMFDVIILLQPTSPLRNIHDINKSIELFFKNKCQSLASITYANESPILFRTIDDDVKMNPILNTKSTIRRQDMPQYYKINGAIYINKVSEIDKNLSFNDNKIGYLMDKNSSIDIDNLCDLKVFRNVLKQNNKR